MSNDRRIDYIEFVSPDLRRSKEFYTTVFGWKFTDWGDEYVSFEDGRIAGGFRKSATSEGGDPLVIMYAENLEDIEKQVRRGGGSIVQEIFSFPGGRRFHFSDPTGNVLAVWSDRGV